jgi:hypothetical protein
MEVDKKPTIQADGLALSVAACSRFDGKGWAMADGVLEVELGPHGGDLRFKTFDEIGRWIEGERTAWTWMVEGGPDRLGTFDHVSNRLGWLRDQAIGAQNAGNPVTTLGHLFHQVFMYGDSILASNSDLGARVIDIYHAEGRDAAVAAYAMALRRINMQNLAGLDELRGVMALAVPTLINAEAVRRRLEAERRNLKDRADRLSERLEDEAMRRWEQHAEDRAQGRAVAVRWVRRNFRRWSERYQQGVAASEASSAAFVEHREHVQSEFDQLRAAFLETMKLQAPAKYWRDKADLHLSAEAAARGRLVKFFPLAIMGLTVAFVTVSMALLRAPKLENATAIYLVASGGLATLAGVTFWIGRLLTKLYLSEHHLRIDAEEREIMTTTYLALTKDAAAGEADRQIILTALFRSTPDGIVKDDGSVDVSVAGLLSRIGIPGR